MSTPFNVKENYMIITGSYFSNMRDSSIKYVSIATYPPKGVSIESIDILKPSFVPFGMNKSLLRLYKDGNIDKEEYKEIYKGHLEKNKDIVIAEIAKINSALVALVCWERSDFCHRDLVLDKLEEWDVFEVRREAYR